MSISTKVICDSINPAGDRITTGVWTYPRFILCEVNTHRMLAKNTASSRAIPVEKMVEAVRENPAMFEQYGAANKGMQAAELMNDPITFKGSWQRMGKSAALWAEYWKDSAAKQMVNRAMEPWMWTTQIITGTDWHNFFALRAHPDAQPEFQVLAYRWLDAYLKSEPRAMPWGAWHLPLIRGEDLGTSDFETTRKISVARCARVSYTRHDQVKTVEEDVALHDRMLSSGHMSPFEHQACATQFGGVPHVTPEYISESGSAPLMLIPNYFGCFRGWRPYRKFLPNENRTNVDLHALLAAKPDWITLP